MRSLFCFFGMIAFVASGVSAWGQSSKARRIESVIWNPSEHKLTWTVLDGTVESGGAFKSNASTTYVIDMDSATMNLKTEGRRFSKAEAARVHTLMNIIAKYAAESTVWWEAGEGEPVTGDEKAKPDEKRREGPEAEPTPPRRRPLPKGDIVKISVPETPTGH